MKRIIWVLFIISSISTLFNKPILGINLTIEDLVILLIFVVILFINIFKGRALLFKKIFSNLLILLILLFLTIGCLLGLVRSNNIISSTANILQYFFIFIILKSVLEYLTSNKLDNIVKIIYVFLIPAIIAAVLVLLSKFNILNVFDETIVAVTGRYQGFDGLPTNFGNNLALNFGVVLFLSRITNNKYLKLINFLLSLIIIYAALLSGSFGSLLIIITIIVSFFWFTYNHKYLFKLISIAVILFILTFYYQIKIMGNYVLLKYLPYIMQQRFIKSGDEFGSFDIRMEINNLGLKSFFENIIFGVGYGQFENYNTFHASIHNTFISAAAEMGIFGFIGIALYVFIPIILAEKMLRRSKDKKEKKIITLLLIYSLSRFIMTFSTQEFILRHLWIPILLIFIVFNFIGKSSEGSEQN